MANTKCTNVRLNRLENKFRALWDYSGDHTKEFKYEFYYQSRLLPGNDVIFSSGSTGENYIKNAEADIPENAIKVWFRVKPVAEQDKNGKDYYTGEWAASASWTYAEIVPSAPPTPSVTFEVDTYNSKIYYLSGLLENLGAPDDTDKYEWRINFQIVREGRPQADPTVFDRQIVYNQEYNYNVDDIYDNYLAVRWEVEPGWRYAIRARYSVYTWPFSVRSQYPVLYSEWSQWSSMTISNPAAPTFIGAEESQEKQCYLEWEEVYSATTYTIEYTNDTKFFDHSDAVVAVQSAHSPLYINNMAYAPEYDNMYYFRVKATNQTGDSPWSNIVNCRLDCTPASPTTWSNRTSINTDEEEVILYWLHNSEDGGAMGNTKIELTVDDGEPTTIILAPEDVEYPDGPPKAGEVKIASYRVLQSVWEYISRIRYRMCTMCKGSRTQTYGEWSVMREIQVYQSPHVYFTVTDEDENATVITHYPFYINWYTTPAQQTKLSMVLTIRNEQPMNTVNTMGEDIYLPANSVIFTKSYLGDEMVTPIEMLPSDLVLVNGAQYHAYMDVSMDSGLTASSDELFTVELGGRSDIYDPTLTLRSKFDTVNCGLLLIPEAFDEDGDPIDNIEIDIYRKECDGSLTLVQKGVDPTTKTQVFDPHPVLKGCAYRLVGRSLVTGEATYTDTPSIDVPETAIVLQWDETWTTIEPNLSDIYQGTPYMGSILRLPYNVDVSDSNQPDVTTVAYAGRKNPVAYHGTQIGFTSSWNTDVPWYDKETIFQLRRLMNWNGDVYVREATGSSYWANITISMDITHAELVIPVTLQVTRIEGGRP